MDWFFVGITETTSSKTYDELGRSRHNNVNIIYFQDQIFETLVAFNSRLYYRFCKALLYVPNWIVCIDEI